MESSGADIFSTTRGGRRKQAKPQRKNGMYLLKEQSRQLRVAAPSGTVAPTQVEAESTGEDVVLAPVEAANGFLAEDGLPGSPFTHDRNHNLNQRAQTASPRTKSSDLALALALDAALPTDLPTDLPTEFPSNGVVGLNGLIRMHVLKDNAKKHRSEKGEDEKIQEYLQRSDTAVIFPESFDQLHQQQHQQQRQPQHRQGDVPSLPGAAKLGVANGDDHNTTSGSGSGSGSGSEYHIKCHQCHKGYPGFQALKEHVETMHNQASSLQCSPLPLAAGSQPSSPGSPLASPGGLLAGYACSQCNTTFLNKDQMEKHELLHTPNAQVKCKICNKNFANVYRLQRHMISHDESAVLRKFKCPECEKAFKFKHHLKEHIRIHSGEKPFECANCGKRFSHSGSYSSHMTSKKCLVMNLKVGRGGRTSGNMLDKANSQNRNTKRAAIMPQNNNNNNNNFSPMSNKYRDAAAAFLSVVNSQSSYSSAPNLHPFYMAAAPTMHLDSQANSPLNPYKLSSSLSHILEHLATSPPHRPRLPVKIEEVNADVEDASPTKEHLEEMIGDDFLSKKDTRSESPDHRRSPGQGSNSGDLEAVKRILETVNATVTKQFLVANMKKLSSTSSGSGCPSVASAASPNLNGERSNDFQKDLEVSCKFCQKTFVSPIDLHQHERYLCESQQDMKEGLAAKLEESVTVKTEEVSLNGGCSGSEDLVEEEDEGESITTTDQVSEDGRKVRVRSLIADEQLAVLKGHYSINPRPKKDELSRIAERISFPVRVVQVWFQNTRARDRREGRLVHVPYAPLSALPFPPSVPSTQPTVPSYSTSPSPVVNCSTEQPLDLSTKKSQTSLASTPSSSPRRPNSNAHQSDSGEDTRVMNLSSKSSRSPTPSMHLAYRQLVPFSNNYQHSSCSSGGSSADFRRSPSPITSSNLHNEMMNNNSRLARILAQPPITWPRTINGSNGGIGNLGNIGMVPMDRLVYNSDHHASSSPLPMSTFGLGTMHDHNRPCSSSPSSDKRSWKQSFADEDTLDEADECMHADEDGLRPIKRNKMSPGLKVERVQGGLQGGLQGLDQEPEGQFICDQCDKAFSKQSSLARHKYEHSGQRPHICDVCSKAFKHKHHLTEHKRLHSGEKPFQCSKCLKRFSHSGSYSQHMNHRYSYCKPYRE